MIEKEEVKGKEEDHQYHQQKHHKKTARIKRKTIRRQVSVRNIRNEI